MIAWEVIAALGCLFWIALSRDRIRAWPWELILPQPAPTTERASVVAIVPARNETALLGRTLPALLAQRDLQQVILVDDGSEDGTADLARELARQVRPGVLTVVESQVSAGWAGKVQALARGMAAAPEVPEGAEGWWLLTDADIEHRPDSVRSLLARAEHGYDLVSVMARLRVESFWERLLVPTFVYFFQLLYPFRKVVTSEVAAAAGGCVLLRRSVLERAGGIESIRSAVIDDVALAKSVSRAGGRLWLGLDQGVRSLRAYDHLSGLWQMVARSAYDQLGYRLDLLFAVLLGLSIFFVAPVVLTVYGVLSGLDGFAAGWRIAALALVAAGLQVRALWPAVRHHGLGLGYAVVLPLSSALFGAMTISSAWSHLTGGGVSWRGRKVERPRE